MVGNRSNGFERRGRRPHRFTTFSEIGYLLAEERSQVRNVVLVHGAWADGSGWQRTHDILRARGYNVSVVQNPLTSLADDVAAVDRVLARQDGATLLVGQYE